MLLVYECLQVANGRAASHPSGSGGTLSGEILVQVEAPLALVVVTRTPHLSFLFDLLTAMFGTLSGFLTVYDL